MNSKKRCLINFFSEGREAYLKGTERLVNCGFKVGLDADILVHSSDFNRDIEGDFTEGNKIYSYMGYPITTKYGECRPHKEAPYQFKAYAIQNALEKGYEKILWCDSSIMLFKNPEHYWELAHEIGVVLFDNQGCIEATWTSDDCLEAMGCSVEYARTFFQCDAGIMMLDFTHFKTKEVFDDYMKYCNDDICLKGVSKSTRQDFTAHRHDQSIISYIAKKHYVNFINYGGWTYGGDPAFMEGKYNPTFAKVGIPRS